MTDKELYEKYKSLKDDNETKEVIIEIMNRYPSSLKYIKNRIDSCFGPHKVYVVIICVDGVDMVKIGYTKQKNIKDRFTEKRYKGSEKIELKNIILEHVFPAKGAVEFEKVLQKECLNYKINSNLDLPGKGEFYDIKHLDEIVEIYNRLAPIYISVIGVKPPN
jgi:hypothetical protein